MELVLQRHIRRLSWWAHSGGMASALSQLCATRNQPRSKPIFDLKPTFCPRANILSRKHFCFEKSTLSLFRGWDGEKKLSRVCLIRAMLVQKFFSQCVCCVLHVIWCCVLHVIWCCSLHVIWCAFDAHLLDVGLAEQSTPYRFVGILNASFSRSCEDECHRFGKQPTALPRARRRWPSLTGRNCSCMTPLLGKNDLFPLIVVTTLFQTICTFLSDHAEQKCGEGKQARFNSS